METALISFSSIGCGTRARTGARIDGRLGSEPRGRPAACPREPRPRGGRENRTHRNSHQLQPTCFQKRVGGGWYLECVWHECVCVHRHVHTVKPRGGLGTRDGAGGRKATHGRRDRQRSGASAWGPGAPPLSSGALGPGSADRSSASLRAQRPLCSHHGRAPRPPPARPLSFLLSPDQTNKTRTINQRFLPRGPGPSCEVP